MNNSHLLDIYEDVVITKPWGQEVIYTPENLNYTFKLMHIKKDCRLSLQSHTEKVETFVLIKGKAELIIGTDVNALETIVMEPMRGYTINVNTIHRMKAVEEDAYIMEGSTPETGTTIRYQDDYGRPNETEEIRKMKNRGWDVSLEKNDRTKE